MSNDKKPNAAAMDDEDDPALDERLQMIERLSQGILDRCLEYQTEGTDGDAVFGGLLLALIGYVQTAPLKHVADAAEQVIAAMREVQTRQAQQPRRRALVAQEYERRLKAARG